MTTSTGPLRQSKNTLDMRIYCESEIGNELNPLEIFNGVTDDERRQSPFRPVLPIKAAADFAIFRKILCLIWPLLGGRNIFVLFTGLEVGYFIFMNWQ